MSRICGIQDTTYSSYHRMSGEDEADADENHLVLFAHDVHAHRREDRNCDEHEETSYERYYLKRPDVQAALFVSVKTWKRTASRDDAPHAVRYPTNAY